MRGVKTWFLTKGLKGIWLNLSLQHIINIDFESPIVSDEDMAAEIVDNVQIKLHSYILLCNLQRTFTYIILNT